MRPSLVNLPVEDILGSYNLSGIVVVLCRRCVALFMWGVRKLRTRAWDSMLICMSNSNLPP